MKPRTVKNEQIGAELKRFTEREESLLKRIKDAEIEIPFHLKQENWRTWVGDVQIYLNQLRNLLPLENGQPE